MLNKIKDLKKDELIKGGAILFIMIVLYNLFNYIFQITMARLLGPSDYGVLAVLMSIIYVFAIPGEAIQTIITRYVSILSIGKENGKIKDLLIRSLKKGLFFSGIIFILFVIASFFLSYFLDISVFLLILTGIFIFLIFLVPVVRGIFQGSKKFLSLGMNMIFESLSKLIVSIGLVLFGWKVYGAMIGVLFGTIFAIIISVFSLKEVLKSKKENILSENIYKSSIPILIVALSIVLMYSIDIILARRFFTPEIAGQYAFVSLIAKVIVFVSSAIGKAMFPISTSEFESGNKNNNSTLKKSLLIVGLMALFSLCLYISIPELIVKIISLGSDEYLSASHILFSLGLAYSFISLAYIILLYKLSQNKINKSAWILLIFLSIQVLLLYLFHSNLLEYTLATLFSSLLIFLYSVLLIRK